MTPDQPTPFAPPELNGPQARFALEKRSLSVDHLAAGSLRFRWQEDDEQPAHSFALADSSLGEGFSAQEGDHAEIHTLRAGGLELRVGRRGAIWVEGESLATPVAIAPVQDRAREPGRVLTLSLAPGARVFGGGEKTGHLHKRGQVLHMWNTDRWLYDRTSDPIYKAVPFFLILQDGRCHGLFLDAPQRSTFDLGATETERFVITTSPGPLELHLIPGPSPAEVLDRYTQLTGRPFLPPRWALGLHQCRYSYFPEERVRRLAETFRRKRIPCDAIWLDIHHMDRFRSFTFDPTRFPNPSALTEELRQLDFHTVVITDPGLATDASYEPYASGQAEGHFVCDEDGQEVRGEVWPGNCAFPDFTAERTRAWWGRLAKGLVEAGVDGIWNDMNEPRIFSDHGTLPDAARHAGDHGSSDHAAVHNAYGHLMARATAEGLRELSPERRAFVLTRSAFAGTQAYAASWSGDNASTWDDLRLSVPMALNMAVCGFPMYGPDIGGFGGAPSPELFTRWLQVGAFFGLMRIHSAYGTPDQEPWSHGHEVEDLNRAAIELRYRLLPLQYSLMLEAHRSGKPPLRPVWFEEPKAWALLEREDLFFLGSDLLVAPVLEEGIRLAVVPVPEGRWFTFPGAEPLPRDVDEVTLGAALGEVPMLVRAGGILPWGKPAQTAAETAQAELTIRVHPGAPGQFVLHEDAGDGPATATSDPRRIRFQLTPLPELSEDSFRLEVHHEGGTQAGPTESFRIEIAGLAGHPLALSRDGQALGPDDLHHAPEARLCTVALACPEPGQPRSLEIHAPTAGEEEPGKRIVVRPREGSPEGLALPTSLVLEGPQHRRADTWWTPKRIGLQAELGWDAQGLTIRAVVEDFAPAPPCENPQGDGLQLVLPGPADGGSHPERLFVRVPEEAGGVWRAGTGGAEQPAPEIPLELSREGRRVSFLFRLPAALFGRERLAVGDELPFDLGAQLSDRNGRRGRIEWVRHHPNERTPGGRLVLGD